MHCTIWKFPIDIEFDRQTIEVPAGASIIHVGLDPAGQPCVWAEVEPHVEKIEREIFIRGTGHPIDKVKGSHRGSFVHGPFVWHVYSIE